ncbi:hypothetical protein [Thioclava sp. GXIMD4215]|uniref:hypothetical protein n=1 Tax=Thioclava sp. GXIMD4215 TaxID=3131928 RepID=UPI0032538339
MAKVAVTFLRGWSRYNANETAGFDADQAQELVDAGIAKWAPAKAKTGAGLVATSAADADAYKKAMKAVEDEAKRLEAVSADLEAREAALIAREEALASGTVTDADGVVKEVAADEKTVADDGAASLPKQGKKA